MSELKDRNELILDWIYDAADNIKKGLSEGLNVDEKTARNDLVTNIDKSTESYFVDKIRENYPDEKIISEEGFGDDLTSMEGNIWIIDPIDGTLNFVKQHKNFCIMIALYKDGVGELSYIYDVYNDLMYSAIRGEGAFLNRQKLPMIQNKGVSDGLIATSSIIMTRESTHNVDKINEIVQDSLGVRIIGSAGLEACDVATNALTAYIAKSLSPWDIAAGKLIIEELGGIVRSLDWQEINFLEAQPTIFANPQAYNEIKDRLSR